MIKIIAKNIIKDGEKENFIRTANIKKTKKI